MNRQKIIVIVSSVVVGALCIAAAVFVYLSFSAAKGMEERRNQTFNDLQAIYNSKAFPSDGNIASVKKEQQELEGWLASVSNSLHGGTEAAEPGLTNVRFKQILQDAVRSLAREGKSSVAPDFKFGFDSYLGESDTLPDPANVARLDGQLGVIRGLVRNLFEARVIKLEAVGRELFDAAKKDDQSAAEVQNTGRRGRRRGAASETADDDTAKAAATAIHVSDSGLYSGETYTLQFLARPAEFTEVLNRLASDSLFVTVKSVDVRKTEDILARQAEERKKQEQQAGSGAAAAPKDLSKVSHADRIVCDPTRDAPLRVKLTVDVYSFSGV